MPRVLRLVGPTQNPELAFQANIKKIKSVADVVCFCFLSKKGKKPAEHDWGGSVGDVQRKEKLCNGPPKEEWESKLCPKC